MKSFTTKMVAVFAFISGMVLSVNAQDEVTLNIGDAAPSMQYSKWLKGTPIETFNGDQLYILEFWATWCGPCKAAMPHLTKLQKEYDGKARIIGVGVWEKVRKGEPYETSLPSVAKYVEGNSANMGYSVIADNNDQFMANNWLKAAGINGIPSTFIIRDKKIIWIGHPIKLDSMLRVIGNGSYNMQEYKLAYEKRREESRKQSAAMRAAMKPVEEAMEAKDYKKAFEMMEKAKVDAPILKISMDNMKFNTLLKHVSQEEAIAFALEWEKEFKSAPSYVLNAVSGEDGLSKRTYLWAAKNFESKNTSSSNSNPVIYHILASCYSKGGDYKNAISNEEKAIESAKTALKEGKMIGTIMDYTVKEYEEALAIYRKENKTTKN